MEYGIGIGRDRTQQVGCQCRSTKIGCTKDECSTDRKDSSGYLCISHILHQHPVRPADHHISSLCG
jgi:hypothetical protein